MKVDVVKVIIFLTVLLVTGCGETEEETGTVARAELIFGSSCSEEGAITYADKRLTYYDLESGESTVLCTKAGCSHQSPEECSACFDVESEEDLAALLHRGKLYVMANSDLEKSVLYEADRNGQNRKELAALDYVLAGDSTLIAEGDYLYAALEEVHTDKTTGEVESFPVLLRISLSSGKTEVLNPPQKEYMARITLDRVRDGMVYYRTVFWDKNREVMDNIDDTESEKAKKIWEKYRHEILCTYDTSTGESEKTEGEKDIKYTFLSQDGDRLYYVEENGDVYVWNRDGSGRELLWQGDKIKDEVYSMAFDDFYLVAEEKDGVCRYHEVFYRDGEEKIFDQKERKIFRFVQGDKFISINRDDAGVTLEVSRVEAE